jgi:Sulfotransferase domain
VADNKSSTSESDIILVAASTRSGQTWLCYMLANLANARIVEPYCLLRGIVYTGNDYVRQLTRGTLPGRAKSQYTIVAKTHEHPDSYYSLTPKLILLVRDPRDTVSSATFRYRIMTTTGTDVEEDARESTLVTAPLQKPLTIKDRAWRLVHANRFLAIVMTARKWRTFYQAWRQVPFAYVVTFESLLEQPEATLQGICNFLEMPIPPEQIRESIQALSMKEINLRQAPTNSNQKIGFRKGVVGDHKSNLSRLELAVIRRYCRRIATKFGYEL